MPGQTDIIRNLITDAVQGIVPGRTGEDVNRYTASQQLRIIPGRTGEERLSIPSEASAGLWTA